MVDFKDFFPILTIDDEDLIVSKKGDISLAFEVKLPEVFSLDKESLILISDTIANGLRNLPVGTIFQKQDYFFMKNNTEPVSTSTKYLSKSDNTFFYETPVLEHKCYFILTHPKINSKNKVSETRKKNKIEQFIKLSKAFINKLTLSEYFNIRQLNEGEIIALMQSYFSLSNQGLGRDEEYEISFDKGFRVKDNFVSAFSMGSCHSLPKSFSLFKRDHEYSTDRTDFFVPFTHNYVFSISCSHLYNQTIFLEDSDSVKSEIEKKSNNFKGLRKLSRFNMLANETLNSFLDQGEKNDVGYVKVNFNMFLWNPQYDILENNVNQVRKEFQNSGIKTIYLTSSLKNFYQSNCPGNSANMDKVHQFILPIEAVSAFLNFETTNSKATSGILLCDRVHGEPIRVDLWDIPLKKGLIVNRNRLIFGPSGTGKSFLINHIVSQYYEQGHHVIIMDIGNSYKKLCYLVGGDYLEYEKENPLQFNPFNIENYNIEKKEFLVSLLLFLWKGNDNKASREEKNALSKYLGAFFEKAENDTTTFLCFNAFYEFVSENDIEEAESFFNKKSFLFSTADFYKGGDYDFVLNANSKMNFLHKRFIVFELDNIKDHPILFPLIVMLLIETTMDKIRNLPGVRKSIFIDECWKPLSQGEMVGFIKYLYKTIRKFYGEIAIATQDVDDIISTDAGPAMINNTDTFFLLSHKKKLSLKDKFSKYLSFTDSDISKLYSTAKRQVFIKMGSLSNVYNLKVSTQRYACYTSNGDENETIYKTYEKTENIKMALEDFIEEMK
ncbi:TraG family conjugative transposon ATPase [Galbibacter sp. EGI 63066]|uniref:TraG family conjugative transposon ATPase n=1 Tax=Galbibacter sp. EGI 63066 TaxID=2993559 RepID=UPI002249470D|nr:TraG family conjugative transposon ATPase [Galbibacter sp. EGI 63066]MCX2681925.1 TraG family conjugative transposon ATPase [Galbibacter sp. EGI 63066]